MVDRPFLVYHNVIPLVQENDFSFPSEHATIYGALAVIAFAFNSRWGILVGICALLVGISRIIAGVHYPIDVIAGFCIGIFVASALNYFFRKKLQ